MFSCMECNHKFRTVKAAERASNHGCPKCGGSDIDLTPVKTKTKPKAKAVSVNGW